MEEEEDVVKSTKSKNGTAFATSGHRCGRQVGNPIHLGVTSETIAKKKKNGLLTLLTLLGGIGITVRVRLLTGFLSC